MPASMLPVLDVEAFARDEASPGAAAFVDELRRTMHDIGFFYVVGHGIDPDRAAQVHDVARAFFALPERDRLDIGNDRSPHFRGYTRYGHERTNGLVDWRDQVDVGRDDPVTAPGPDDPAWLWLRGPNLWPAALPELRPVMTRWMGEMEQLCQTLLRAMAVALGQPAGIFDGVVRPPDAILKIIRYLTPDGAGPVPQGVGAHRDTGFLAIVHQDGIGGLRVHVDGDEIDVPLVPAAFVVNIGEMLQLLTQGYFRATVHQVAGPPPGVERVSFAYLFNPKLEATFTPLDLPGELAAHARGGASIDPGNPILANYGDNMLKARLRSHPDVAERHHADLLAAGPWGR